MSGWQAILNELHRAIEDSFSFLPAPERLSFQSIILDPIQSSFQELSNLLGVPAFHKKSPTHWQEALSMLESWLEPVMDARTIQSALLQNQVCSILEKLARNLADQYDKYLEKSFPEVAEMWWNVRKKIENSFDLFKIEIDQATETEFLNVAQDCDLRTLSVMKKSIRERRREADARFLHTIKNIFESTRFGFHYKKLISLPEEKWEKRIQRYLVRKGPIGSIGRTHVGFMTETYARDFLDNLKPIYYHINGTARLIAYLAGINAFPKLAELFEHAQAVSRQEALLEALRIIGGPKVTIMFSHLLQRQDLQFTVASHLIDMASMIDVFVSDDWVTRHPKPARGYLGPLQSSVDRPSKENWFPSDPKHFLVIDVQTTRPYQDLHRDSHAAARRVRLEAQRLCEAHQMPHDLAFELMTCIDLYLKNL